MKKIKIRLKYNEDVYESHILDMSKEDLDSIEEDLETIAKGDINYFSFTNEVLNESYYFTKHILERSIVTLLNMD